MKDKENTRRADDEAGLATGGSVADDAAAIGTEAVRARAEVAADEGAKGGGGAAGGDAATNAASGRDGGATAKPGGRYAARDGSAAEPDSGAGADAAAGKAAGSSNVDSADEAANVGKAAGGPAGGATGPHKAAGSHSAAGRENISPGIYFVTDAELCSDIGVVKTAIAAVDGGVETVQVRHKPADGGEVLEVVLAVAEAIGDWAKVIVNDRIDVFLAARAMGASVHGVHIGQSDMPAKVVRKLVGPDAIIGLSASTPQEINAVAALPRGTVDYVGVGTVREQSVKTDAPPPMGIEGVSAVARRCAIPCVAIGGVRAADIGPLRRGGLHGAAVVSAICGTPSPEESARKLVRAWHTAGPKDSREFFDRAMQLLAN